MTCGVIALDLVPGARGGGRFHGWFAGTNGEAGNMTSREASDDRSSEKPMPTALPKVPAPDGAPTPHRGTDRALPARFREGTAWDEV
jgi:hypothetical protein